MANNYLQFSTQLENLTDEEIAWFERMVRLGQDLQDDVYESEDEFLFNRKEFTKETGINTEDMTFPLFGFKVDREAHAIWFYSEESDNPDDVANLIHAFFRKFHRKSRRSHWFSWSYTCSKLRLDEFGGGACFITAQSIKYIDAASYVQALHRKWTSKGVVV